MNRAAMHLFLLSSLFVACKGNDPTPTLSMPIRTESGSGPVVGNGSEPAVPTSMFKLMTASASRTVLAVGRVGTVADSPSYTIRYFDGDITTSYALRFGATYLDYDYYQVPFVAERILYSNPTGCGESSRRGEILAEYVAQFAKRYPRFVDSQGREVAPVAAGGNPFRDRHPKQTLVSGERIVLAFSCMLRAQCGATGACPNPILWKFPVSADDKIDFSEFSGPDGLSFADAEAWLASDAWIRLAPPRPDGGAADPGQADGGAGR